VHEGPDVLERADLVVAPGERFEQGLVPAAVCNGPHPEELHGGLGQTGHRSDVLGAVRRLRVSVQVVQMLLDPLVGVLSCLLDQGALEELEAHGPGQVTERGVAQLGGADQPVE